MLHSGGWGDHTPGSPRLLGEQARPAGGLPETRQACYGSEAAAPAPADPAAPPADPLDSAVEGQEPWFLEQTKKLRVKVGVGGN